MEIFFEELEKLIQSKHLLKHSFYKAWSEGSLTTECLQEYAKEYYHHVKAFPTYLSGLHSHVEDAETRKSLLQNLIDEENGNPNHPDLWKQFAINLGVKPKELSEHLPCQEIKNLINVFRGICREKDTCDGLAALYAYESQIPTISESKIEGLRKFYNFSEFQWRYFSVHIEADVEHAKVERELLKKHVNKNNFLSALASAKTILEALWDFLTYLTRRYHLECV